ncbi:3-dehydrosphinganine reductase [Nematocida sp. AWRm80]|nr:3-dehydrosphinganine reductase [Nematocida sp. AWRm80]
MIMFVSIAIVVLILSVGSGYLRSRRRYKYQDKNVLIVGGCSGLGLALAIELTKRGSIVTVTSRDKSTLRKYKKEYGFKTLPLDVTEDSSVKKIPEKYQLIFCCAGIALPGLATEITIEEVKQCIDTNYLGSIRVFLHFLKHCTPQNRKRLVFISSTLGLRSFIGYGAYSPSKAALRSFFESVREESALNGLDLSIYYVSTINSPGYSLEQKRKPLVTKAIEGPSVNYTTTPENRAITLLNNLPDSVIVSDTITQMFLQAPSISTFSDYILWRVSPPFMLLFHLYCKYHIRTKYKQKTI